jgi:NADH dehydrogenase/NADH:ubiquinone oxidoreductase subunit G
MGLCYECLVTVDGIPNVRACLTPVAEGMVVETTATVR